LSLHFSFFNAHGTAAHTTTGAPQIMKRGRTPDNPGDHHQEEEEEEEDEGGLLEEEEEDVDAGAADAADEGGDDADLDAELERELEEGGDGDGGEEEEPPAAQAGAGPPGRDPTPEVAARASGRPTTAPPAAPPPPTAPPPRTASPEDDDGGAAAAARAAWADRTRALAAAMTEDQMDRYEAFRRATLGRPAVKKVGRRGEKKKKKGRGREMPPPFFCSLITRVTRGPPPTPLSPIPSQLIHATSGSTPNSSTVILVAGVAKVFVAELVEAGG
jgi:hypothetical protein